MKKMYQWEEYTRIPRKLPKTTWGRSNIQNKKNINNVFSIDKGSINKENLIWGKF